MLITVIAVVVIGGVFFWVLVKNNNDSNTVSMFKGINPLEMLSDYWLNVTENLTSLQRDKAIKEIESKYRDITITWPIIISDVKMRDTCIEIQAKTPGIKHKKKYCFP